MPNFSMIEKVVQQECAIDYLVISSGASVPSFLVVGIVISSGASVPSFLVVGIVISSGTLLILSAR